MIHAVVFIRFVVVVATVIGVYGPVPEERGGYGICQVFKSHAVLCV